MSRLPQRAALAGRNAVIVGGGAGIGKAVTLSLASEGVNVAICDVDADKLRETSASATSLGVGAFGATADVTDPLALASFYDLVEQRFGHVDILVNIAGGTQRRSFAESEAAADDRDIRLNYGYVLQSVRRAIPLLRKSGRGGSIINFTTIEAHRGAATFAVYAGAKAATRNFSSALAVELGAERIRVNCIAPDTTPSRGNANAVPEIAARMAALPVTMRARSLAMYAPLKAAPDPDGLADAVLFLASDLSAFITGTTIHVDGGTHAASGFLDWPFGDGFVPAPMAGTLQRLFGSSDD